MDTNFHAMMLESPLQPRKLLALLKINHGCREGALTGGIDLIVFQIAANWNLT